MNIDRGFGWVEDPAKGKDDKPDWDLADLLGSDSEPAFRFLTSEELPRSDSVREFIVDGPLRQSRIGSCVTNSGFQGIRSAHNRDGVQNPKLGSRLAQYFLCRSYIHTENWDSGCHIRDFFRSINDFGFLPEDDYDFGYDITKYNVAPPPVTFRRMFDQRLKQDESANLRYWRIYDTGEARLVMFRQCLAQNLFVVFGTKLSEEFVLYDQGDKVWDVPTDTVGGHAMMLTDYFEDGHFGAIGSWGPDAHDHGYHHFTPDYMAWAGTRDCWAIERPPYYSFEAS